MSQPRARRSVLLALVAAVLGTGVTTGADAVEVADGLDLDRLRAATVLISPDPVDGTAAGGGSGSVIGADGLILTNAHVAAPTAPGVTLLYPSMHYEPEPSDELYVYTVDDDGGQASPAYRAEVVAADGYLDLAVLRIVAKVDGGPLDPQELDLPTVPIGRGLDLRPLDEVTVAGYPGIADTLAVRFSRGEVHNFSDDPLVGPDAWIHTDAKIASGNSGGLAADAQGRLVAVPTMTTSDGPDGAVDYNMRPVELALPLIEAARAGRTYDGSRYLTPPTGDEFARVQGWASESTEECVADSGDAAFPSGTWELFPQVRFAGMSAGVPVLVELVELGGPSGEVEVRDYAAFEWEEESGTTACMPFDMWYDRALPYREFRSFRDGVYGVRVRVGLGLSDMAEVSEDPRLTAATVGSGGVMVNSDHISDPAVPLETLDEASGVASVSGVTASDDDSAQVDDARPDQADEPWAGIFPRREVVVAADYLEAGFPIEASMVHLREVEVDESNAAAYGDPADVVGWVPAIDIFANQPITPTMLLEPSGGSVSGERVPLEVVEHGMSVKGGTLSYAVVLRNPNEARWSAEHMPVRVAALDRRGRVIATTREMASLVPGQTGAVVGDIPGAKRAVAIEVAVADGEGSWVQRDFVAEGLDLSAVKSSRQGARPITKGRLETWFGDWHDGVQVMAVYRDRKGRIIGGDSTYLRVVPGSETTPFRIRGSGLIPARAVQSTEVFYEL